jgi:hypothetical protein
MLKLTAKSRTSTITSVSYETEISTSTMYKRRYRAHHSNHSTTADRNAATPNVPQQKRPSTPHAQPTTSPTSSGRKPPYTLEGSPGMIRTTPSLRSTLRTTAVFLHSLVPFRWRFGSSPRVRALRIMSTKAVKPTIRIKSLPVLLINSQYLGMDRMARFSEAGPGFSERPISKV